MSKPQKGLFPACFTVSHQQFGSVTLNLSFLVNTVTQSVSGEGSLGQPVSPPTMITVGMGGLYSEKGGKIRVVAGGGHPGASIQVSMLLDSWDGPGTADIKWMNKDEHRTADNVPVQSTPCFA
jgi:hypothetical protein